MSLICFVVLCAITSSSFAIISLGKRERCLLYFRCCRSFALLRGAMVWSVVCDCGISWSYSLTLCYTNYK